MKQPIQYMRGFGNYLRILLPRHVHHVVCCIFYLFLNKAVVCQFEVGIYKRTKKTEQNCQKMKRCNLVQYRNSYCSGDRKYNFVLFDPVCSYSECQPDAVAACVFCITQDTCFGVPATSQSECEALGYVCVSPGFELQPNILGYSATPDGCRNFSSAKNCMMSVLSFLPREGRTHVQKT